MLVWVLKWQHYVSKKKTTKQLWASLSHRFVTRNRISISIRSYMLASVSHLNDPIQALFRMNSEWMSVCACVEQKHLYTHIVLLLQTDSVWMRYDTWTDDTTERKEYNSAVGNNLLFASVKEENEQKNISRFISFRMLFSCRQNNTNPIHSQRENYFKVLICF